MLPEKFKIRMMEMLGEDYDSFERALGEDNVRAIRVNETKISVEDFLKVTELALSPIPYANEGFIPEDCEGIGRRAEHHAGMFYVQDPGAMATVKAVEIQPGWSVLDACAAPGGKASQLATAVGREGFIWANEFVPKRAKIIVSNFERLGIGNAMITSLDTARIGEMVENFFDLVLCDAPCSGEGMFRKYDEALSEWSEENVALCAERQKTILGNLAGTVRPGGYLVYSTCTYSREENEGVVSHFLQSHPDFSLHPVAHALIPHTADGLDTMTMARRFYPHIAPGEGQFIAVLKKEENSAKMSTILYKENVKPLSKEESAVLKKFICDNISGEIEGRFIKCAEQIVLVNHKIPLPAFGVFMPGVMLGEVKKGNFFPHHQFFSVYGNRFKLQQRLTKDDPRTEKYLRGEEIDTVSKDSGWCAVLYEGVALGGGKMSNCKIKNHYPKGLRNN